MKAQITPSSQAHHGALPRPGHRPRRIGAQRGAVLLVSLGVLFLLAMFAVSFAQMTALERAASANHITRIESSTVCSGGLQAGIQLIRNFTRENGVTRFGAVLSQNGEVINPNSVPHPFFIPGEPREDPTTSKREFGIHKGSLTGTGRYEVRVIDCSGQININDTFDPNFVVLRRVLISLGQALEANAPVINGTKIDFNPLSEADVTAIIAARQQQPGRVFASKEAVFRALPAQSASGKNRSQRFAAFRDFITAHSWRDGGVIDPGIDVDLDGTHPPLPRPYVNTKGAGAGIVKLAARSPVNINVAPAEVIAAVLAGLCANAYEIREIPGAPAVRGAVPTEIVAFSVEPISFDQARAIAAVVVAWRREFEDDEEFVDPRGPFENWSQFERFMLALDKDSSPPSPYSGELGIVKDNLPGDLKTALDSLTRPQIQAIIANADPNARFVGVQPADPVRLQTQGAAGNKGFLVDKAVVRFVPDPDEPSTRLDHGTTEFCFGSTGYFEVVSLGRMATWNDQGTPSNIHDDTPIRGFARQGQRVTIRLFHTLRHTTQLDFKQAYERATNDLLDDLVKPSFTEARTAEGLRFESHPNLGTKTDIRNNVTFLPGSDGVADYPLFSAVDGWLQIATPGREEILGQAVGDPVLESFDDSPDDSINEPNDKITKVDFTFTRDRGSVLRGGLKDNTKPVGQLIDPNQEDDDIGDFGPDGMICWATPVIADHFFIPTAADEASNDIVLDGEGTTSQTENAVNVGQGAIEFWYRPFTDGDLGSNEPLFHMVRRGPGNNQLSRYNAVNKPLVGTKLVDGAGMCLRVTRFGDKLVAVIFYWGLPQGSLPPEEMVNRAFSNAQDDLPTEGDARQEFNHIPNPIGGPAIVDAPRIFREVEANLSDLLGGGASRAGEWHHVYVSWRKLTELSLFIDGKKVQGSDAAAKSFEDETFKDGEGVQRDPEFPAGESDDDQGDLSVDATGGTGANTFLRRINADGTVDETDGGRLAQERDEQTVKSIIGHDSVKLVRLVSQSDNNRLYIGGIQDKLPLAAGDVIGAGVNVHEKDDAAGFAVSTPEGDIRRGANLVIDDVLIYHDPDARPSGGSKLNDDPKRFSEFDGSVDDSKPLPEGESPSGNISDDKRCQFIGAFPLPRLPATDDSGSSHTGGYQLGTVHFTVRQPGTWQGNIADIQALVRVGTRGEVLGFSGSGEKSHLHATEVKLVESGSSLPRINKESNGELVDDPDRFIPLSNANPALIFYQVEFRNVPEGGNNDEKLAARNTTPLFDDITVTVFPPSPQIVEHLFDSEIN